MLLLFLISWPGYHLIIIKVLLLLICFLGWPEDLLVRHVSLILRVIHPVIVIKRTLLLLVTLLVFSIIIVEVMRWLSRLSIVRFSGIIVHIIHFILVFVFTPTQHLILVIILIVDKILDSQLLILASLGL